MRKWEWVKTVLAAAAAAALMLFLGDKNAFFNWAESLIVIAVLAGGFYGGLPAGSAAGAAGGLLSWYFMNGGPVSFASLTVGGIFCALFRQLGKGAAALSFLSGSAMVYLVSDTVFPSAVFESILVAMAVFLIVSPGRKYRGMGSTFRASGAGNGSGSSAAEESAAALAPAAAQRRWRRLADNFITLANCFDDQSLMVLSGMKEELTAAEWKQRFLESRQAIRLQFMETGQVIQRQQEKMALWQDVTNEYEEKLKNRLKSRHISWKELQIIENSDGRQEIFAWLSCGKGVHLTAQEAAALFHTKHGKKFCPAYDCRSVIGGRPGDVHFIEKQTFQVLYGLAKKNKAGEDCSGDSFSAKMLGEERMLLCLSDGMGTGKRAGRESEMAVELLEQLLENGFSLMAAVSMINQILLNWRGEQTPTTLDICVVNLYNGICQFAKLGAATGYLKRGTSVSAIRGQAVPLGMISWEEVGTEQSMVPEEQLKSGDMLILMTDGVSEKAGLAADEILKELIAECTIRKAGEFADWLMERILMLDDTIRDDMTILVAGVWRK